MDLHRVKQVFRAARKGHVLLWTKTVLNASSYWANFAKDWIGLVFLWTFQHRSLRKRCFFDFLPQSTQFKEFDTPMEYKNLTKYSESYRPRIGTELNLLGLFHRPHAFFRTRRDITVSQFLCPSAMTSNALTLVIHCDWCQVICYRPQGKVMFSQACVILSTGLGISGPIVIPGPWFHVLLGRVSGPTFLPGPWCPMSFMGGGGCG